MTPWSTTPFEITSYDNPEFIRFRKYATGTHLVLEGLGVEPGQSPKETVWQKGKARLYRYRPKVEKRPSVPFLVVYAPILRPYILDLVPGNSFVEYLLERGYDVYMLDWGITGEEDKDLSFENYILDYMPEAVSEVLRNSRAEAYTLFGYCMGGTISAMYAAVVPDKHLRNMILLATPVDFAPDDPELLGLWTFFSRNSEAFFDPDLVAETFGAIPEDLLKHLVGARSSAVKPLADRYAVWFHTNVRRFLPAVSADSWLAVSRWVDDGTPLPGELFRRWIRDFYQRNKLVKGEIELRGRRVDLANIKVPLLNIVGKKDVICPLSQAKATMDLAGSRDKELLVLDAGHVGLMAGPAARNELWPGVEKWLEPRSGRPAPSANKVGRT